MTHPATKSKRKSAGKRQGKIEIRDDLRDGSQGRDLSYLSEMPQMGGYEGVKAGLPGSDKGQPQS